MLKVITIGEALVEILRSSAGQSPDLTGEFRGPFAGGALRHFRGRLSRVSTVLIVFSIAMGFISLINFYGLSLELL